METVSSSSAVKLAFVLRVADGLNLVETCINFCLIVLECLSALRVRLIVAYLSLDIAKLCAVVLILFEGCVSVD